MRRLYNAHLRDVVLEWTQDPASRFREPYHAGEPVKCRLWSIPNDMRKGAYQPIDLVRDDTAWDVSLLIKCAALWEKAECAHGWFCHQLKFEDAKIRNNSK